MVWAILRFELDLPYCDDHNNTAADELLTLVRSWDVSGKPREEDPLRVLIHNFRRDHDYNPSQLDVGYAISTHDETIRADERKRLAEQLIGAEGK